MHANSLARLALWTLGAALAGACTDGGGAATGPDGGPRADAAAAADGTAADAGPSDASPLDASPGAGPLDAGPLDADVPDGADAAAPGCEAAAATTADQLAAHYAPHGGRAAFPAAHVALLEATLAADDLTACGDMAQARATLDAVWADWPLSDPRWWGVPSPFGTNVGRPVGYYALRMLDAITARGLGPVVAPDPVRLTVLLVGCSEGLQPRDWAELEAGTGVDYRGALAPGLAADDHRVLRESLDLFGRYVTALTDGRLALEIAFQPLPDVCLPAVSQAAPVRLASVDTAPTWAGVPDDVLRTTDWFWVIYPSRVPDQYPDFEDTEFITGGMGLAPNGGPLFISDDLWLLRKPPHLGDGPMSAVERRVYLPQWLQHEFFHHLFRVFPEFDLEAQGHQWFDRDTWPADFVGAWEPDYYAEALSKRLRGAEPPPHVRLRYRGPTDAERAGLTLDALVGTYVRLPEENPWHRGRIEATPTGARWINEAGVSWGLMPDLAAGRLRSGPDNPYYRPEAPDQSDFRVELARDADGRYRAGVVRGFTFGGELYTRQP